MSTSKPLFAVALLDAIHAQYQLEWTGLHGVRHWARVLDHGLHLAAFTGARTDVVTLFALFHDACRWNDNRDPDHGSRGGELARKLRNTHFELDDEGLALLTDACRRHTLGLLQADPTIQTCWDADRLDLWRVGIRSDPRRLGTDAARNPGLLKRANEGAASNAFPFAEQFAPCSRP